MRLVFAGTPAVAVPTMRSLAAEHEIVAVVTRPDAPLGRKRVLTPSPVAAAAEELGLPVIKAARLDDEATAQITALRAELGVIVDVARLPLYLGQQWDRLISLTGGIAVATAGVVLGTILGSRILVRMPERAFRRDTAANRGLGRFDESARDQLDLRHLRQWSDALQLDVKGPKCRIPEQRRVAPGLYARGEVARELAEAKLPFGAREVFHEAPGGRFMRGPPEDDQAGAARERSA